MRIGNIHPRAGGVTRRGLAIHVCLGNKAPINQLHRAVEFVLGKLQVSAGDTGLRLKRGGLLCLYRTVNAYQDLALGHPIASVDIDHKHAPAFADNANGNFAASGQCAGRIDGARHAIAARRYNGNRLCLTSLICIGGCSIAATEEIISGARYSQNRHDDACNTHPTLVPITVVLQYLVI